MPADRLKYEERVARHFFGCTRWQDDADTAKIIELIVRRSQRLRVQAQIVGLLLRENDRVKSCLSRVDKQQLAAGLALAAGSRKLRQCDQTIGTHGVGAIVALTPCHSLVEPARRLMVPD